VTTTLERRNPLPKGVYWIDLFSDNRAKFLAWRTLNKARVKVVANESFDTEPPRDWVKFQVLEPVTWDAPLFGFPAKAEGVNSSGDTTTNEPEKDPLDQLGEGLPTPKAIGEAFGQLAAIVAIGVGVVVVVNLMALGPRRAAR
jgi:hypothetical protein